MQVRPGTLQRAFFVRLSGMSSRTDCSFYGGRALQFQPAQQLLIRHATTRNLRTLDVLQLAVALAVHAITPLDDFICADANLCLVASAEGLTVINPEVP